MTTDALLLNFVSRHPAHAARRMSEFQSNEVIRLIESLPPDVAAAVSARLSTRQLNDVLESSDRKQLIAMLVSAHYTDLMVLVSHMSDATKAELVEAATPGDQALLQRLLYTRLRTLSAIVSPDFIRVEVTATCGSVRSDLMTSEDGDDLPIFAVNADGTFAGVLSPFVAVRERNIDVHIGDVMEKIDPLSGQMPVAAAFAAPQWQRHRVLPVVDSASLIVGALTYEQLSSARHDSTNDLSFEAMVGQVATSYLDVCVDLLELTVGGDRGAR